MKDSIKSGLLTLFLGSFGQLIARIVYLDGSLDKPWLFIFLSFPLSIVSSIFFFMDKVAKGKGSNPLDVYSWMIPILSIIFAVIFQSICDISDFTAFILIALMNVMVYSMAGYLKRSDVCPPDKKSMTESLYKALIVNLIVPIVNLITVGLSYVPYIGIIFKGYNFLSYVPGLQNGLLLGFSHIIENMMANTESDVNSVCQNNHKLFSFLICGLCIGTIIVSILVGYARGFLKRG